MEALPEHSRLGASSAERWMNCPGSNVLLNTLDLPQSDESEYARDGTAAHEAAAHCLRGNLDSWEIVGMEFHGVKVDAVMADAVQDYMDNIRSIREDHGPNVRSLVEYRISGDFHNLFYGTVDDAELTVHLGSGAGPNKLDINDFKYGEGIAVDAEHNEQMMYYAVGILEKNMFSDDDVVTLRIIQPRAFHLAGPVREWQTTAGALRLWKETKLIPAMVRAEIDLTLEPGEWCRFCPAKIACPLLTALFEASIKADASVLPSVSNAALSRSLKFIAPVKHYLKALEDETYRRMHLGGIIPGFKLVPKKANRVLTTDGVEEAKKQFPIEDLYVTKMKTPAQIALIGPAGKAFVKEYAYTPQTGLTVAPEDDDRVGVKIATPAETFAHITEAA